MALSDDQKAMLRLLAKREEGYEDIAALKGLSVEEVRAEVKAALAELDTPQPEASRQPAPAPQPRLAAKETVEEPTPAAAAKPASVPRGAALRPRQPMPIERRRLLVLMGGALGVVAVVLGAIALIGGDGDSDATGSGADASEIAAVEDERVTQAVLDPAGGGDAAGRALFGRVGKEEVVLQVTAEGLEPTAEGESYTVWLYRSPEVALRVGSVAVDDGEELAARFPIPAELLSYIAGGAFNQIYVSRTSDAAYKREVAQARRQKQLPSYSGETVLSGVITGPLAEAAAKQGR